MNGMHRGVLAGLVLSVSGLAFVPLALADCVAADGVFRQAQEVAGEQRVELLRQVLAQCPKHAPALSALAASRKRAGYLETAQRLYRRAIAADPGFVPAYAGVADVLSARQRHAEAAQAYDRCLHRLELVRRAGKEAFGTYESRCRAGRDLARAKTGLPVARRETGSVLDADAVVTADPPVRTDRVETSAAEAAADSKQEAPAAVDGGGAMAADTVAEAVPVEVADAAVEPQGAEPVDAAGAAEAAGKAGGAGGTEAAGDEDTVLDADATVVAPAMVDARTIADRLQETVVDSCDEPSCAGADQPQLPRKIDIRIYFDSAAARVKPESLPQVAQIAEALRQKGLRDSRILIEGHTDSQGRASYNQRLSEQRARAVRDLLVERYGISPTRLAVQGLGESDPVATNDTESGRARNRRVTLKNLGRPTDVLISY